MPKVTPELPKNIINFINKCSEIKGDYENEMHNMNLWVSCKFGHYGVNMESPIEKILFCAFETIRNINTLPPTGEENDGIFIYPQKIIDRYRVDFLFEYKGTHSRKSNKLIVECDSQEFHEKTEKERRYEKARDRFLINKGLIVYHYTGKEIIDDPFKISAEIISFLTGKGMDEISQGEEYRNE